MEEEIKLFYFHEARGKGEAIRMLLTAAGVKFKDVRIKYENWIKDPSVKEETPYGQLPYVIYQGKKIAQSVPIASYFAKKFGFYGKTDEDALREEEVIHLVLDFKSLHFRDWYIAEGPAKDELGQVLKTERFPRYLGYFEALLKDNRDSGFFVGTSVTLADMYVYDVLETVLNIDADALKAFPLLQKLNSNVKAFPALKDYIATKPKTAI